MHKSGINNALIKVFKFIQDHRDVTLWVNVSFVQFKYPNFCMSLRDNYFCQLIIGVFVSCIYQPLQKHLVVKSV